MIVDDYSRYPCVLFFSFKDEAFQVFLSFCKKADNEKCYSITTIRSDYSGEFDNDNFENFCKNRGYEHNFLAPTTPQQNGIVERKNY